MNNWLWNVEAAQVQSSKAVSGNPKIVILDYLLQYWLYNVHLPKWFLGSHQNFNLEDHLYCWWLLIVNCAVAPLQSSKVVSGNRPACNCQKGVTDMRSGGAGGKRHWGINRSCKEYTIEEISRKYTDYGQNVSFMRMQKPTQLSHIDLIVWRKPDLRHSGQNKRQTAQNRGILSLAT